VAALLNMLVGIAVAVGVVGGFWLLASFSGDLMQQRNRDDRKSE
jgi:hypothetical protein